AKAGDAAFAADVDTAVRPSSPRDPESYEYWWSQPDENWRVARFVVSRGARRIGYATAEHPRWDVQPERYGTVGGNLLPAERTQATLDAILAWLERRLVADGAKILSTRANEDDPVRIQTLLARAYKEGRRSRRWELDLVVNREKLLATTEESRARMTKEGIRIVTLAAVDDAKAVEKIWRLSEEAGADVPTTEPRVPDEMAAYTRWLEAPEIHRDRFWIAIVDDNIVGLSVLAYPPVRGVVSTEWTATARSVRGRGVARALKCETVAQAIALGVDRVRTGNDAANDPILHINETMGYREIAGQVQFLKAV
ncbi:MAG TPA: GNAT family N-acetyltransferase, partial [Candidatus Limnocylindria bacterium]|nr:GNAT family N-acetyltransferase [Candidatus Limnocylindria bacterium]